jgi:hypothetical protein
MASVNIENAYGLVNDAVAYYRGLSESWIELTRNAIADLDSINVEPINFSVDYNVNTWLPAFQRPIAPDDPNLPAVIPVEPVPPVLDTITVRDIGAAPDEPDFSSLALYVPPAPPTDPMPTAPNAADITPQLDDVVVPLPPDYVLPELPTLFSLNLPDAPNIVIPPFTGVRPLLDVDDVETGPLNYTEEAYVSPLREQMICVLRGMMNGGYGLPLPVERAIFDRGRAREDRLSRKQIQEVSEDFAARGLYMDNGILAASLQQVHADNREKVGALNRDFTIQRAQEVLENIRFAVGQGMALEQILVQQNQANNDRALRIATYLRDYMLQRMNAQVSLANLHMQAYQIDAQVWQQQIQGALSQLEIYKAELDGQRIIGELNSQLTQQYEAGIRAVGVMADVYRSNVEAAKARGEINMQRIEAAKLILERYSTQVDAWGKLNDGYRIRVDAALGSTRWAEAMANVYAARVNAYKTKGDAYFREGDFQIQRNAQDIELFRGRLSLADQNLRGQTAQLDAVLRGFEARVNRYQAQGVVSQAESAAMDRNVSLRIENERNRTSVALQQAQIRIDQAIKLGEILVEQIKAKAAALAQLAASSQSGINYGASLSGSVSESWGRSASVGWSGEAPDLQITPNMNF